MKRWLILALLGSPLWGAIAHVTGTGTPHVTSTASTATTCAITYTPNAAGHLIVFALSTATTTISSPSVSDNATGGTSTYVQVGQANNSTNELVTLWYTLSVKSGATTFTASWTTGSRNSCDLTEYSGVAGVGATVTGATGAASPIFAIVHTTSANSWGVVAGSVRGTSTYSTGSSCSPNATCTLEDSIAGGGSTTSGISISDDGNVASSGTSNTVNTTTTGTNWAAVALELMSTLPTPTMNPNGLISNNDVSTAFSDTVAGVTFCSTLDGTTPAATSPPTCSTGSSGASTTVIATGTTVKVLATKTGWVNSAVLTSSAFTLEVGAVTDSPGAGTYTSVQTATLGITTTTGGTVHFTEDNTAATCSSGAYSSPFSVSSTQNVRAVGCKTNYVTSAELNDLYTINISTAWFTHMSLMGISGSTGSVVTATPGFVSNSQEPSSENNAIGTKADSTCATDAFCGHFAQPTLSGNTLVVAYAYKAASANTQNIPVVTDSGTNSYTCVTEANSSSTSFYVGACYSINAASAYAFTVTWSAAVSYPQADGWQGYNIGTFDKSWNNSGTAATTFSAGSGAQSTAQNNEELLQIVKVTSPLATETTASTVGAFTAGSQAGITWELRAADRRDGFAVQDGVLTTAGSINPQITNATSSSYASIALAFQSATQGAAPSGFYIACKGSFNSQESPNYTAGTNIPIQLPCGDVGNEIVIGNTGGTSGTGLSTAIHITSVTGSHTLSECGTWQGVGGGGFSDMWYVPNITESNSEALTVATGSSATGDVSLWSYVLAGGATIGCTGSLAANNGCAGTFPCSLTGGAKYAPQATSGITIMAEEQAANTIVSLDSPCTNGFDSATQGGESLSGPYPSDENNGRGHCLQTSNALQDWQITGSASGTSLSGGVYNLGSFPASTGLYTVQFLSGQGTTAVAPCTTTECLQVSITPKVANDPIVVVVGDFNSTARTVSAVCLDGSADGSTTCNTGTQFVHATSSAISGGSSQGSMDVWYLLAGTTTSAHTITVKYSGTTSNQEIAVWELTSAITAFDLASTSSGTAAGTASGPSLTTTGNPGFCVAGVGVSGGITGNPHAGNEFTNSGVIFSNTSDAAAAVLTSATGTHQAVWDDGGGTYSATTACFK